MTRIVRAALLAIALAAVCAAPAQAAHWTTVSGLIPGSATDAALDGPRVLVTSVSGRHLVVTTVAGNRVARRQTITTAGRLGIVRRLQVVRLTGGRALAVWQEGSAIRASLRPSTGARFSPARAVSPFTGPNAGFALHPDVGVTSAGEPLVAWWGGPAAGRLGIYAAGMAGDGSWTTPVEISAGAYPALPPPAGPQLGIVVAADQAGGLGVAWRQPGGPAEEVVMGVLRAPDGTWGAPLRLGAGQISSLSATAPAAGELLAVWGRIGGPSRWCVDAATLRGAAADRVEVGCRDGVGFLRPRVVRAPQGGAVVAEEVTPYPFTPTGTTVEVTARDAAGAWSPPQLAIALVGDTADPAASTGGRTAVPAVVSRGGVQFTRLSVAVVGADGRVLRRIGGPARPTPPPNTSVRVLPLGPGARVALLLTPAPTLRSSRPSILTLG